MADIRETMVATTAGNIRRGMQSADAHSYA
jgi:hypothetical protein